MGLGQGGHQAIYKKEKSLKAKSPRETCGWGWVNFLLIPLLRPRAQLEKSGPRLLSQMLI